MELQASIERVVSQLPDLIHRKPDRDWFDSEDVAIAELIEKRRQCRIKYYLHSSKENKEAWRLMKKVVQHELRVMEDSYWDRLCNDISSKEASGDSKGYFAAMKQLYHGQHIKEEKVMLKLDGSVTEGSVEYLNRLAEHSKDLLNQESLVSPNIDSYLQVQQPIIDSLDEPWRLDELEVAIQRSKFGKGCGVDKVPIEFVALTKSKLFLERVLNIFNRNLELGAVENILKDVIIMFLFKKGCKLDCNNYRTLSLISHMGKVLERMILNRLNVFAEEKLWYPESQNGFRANRGTVDSLFCSRLISSYCREKGLPCFIAFVDLTKAYDKVNRDILWLVLERLGIPKKLRNLIKDIHVGAEARVRDSGKFSGAFELQKGLKQGSVFAPFLFNVFFGSIIKSIYERLDVEDGIEIKYRIGNDFLDDPQLSKGHRVDKLFLRDLLFADDAAFMASTELGLQKKMDIVVEVVSAYGQLVSVKKTEVMLVQPRVKRGMSPISDPVICIDGNKLNVVPKFKYVGSYLNSRGDVSNEISIRCQKMAAAYSTFQTILFENRRLKLRSKLQGFITFVLSSGLYGCETWNCSSEDVRKLEALQYRYLRRILNYRWVDRKSFADLIYESRECGVDMLPIGALVRMKRLTYFGHVNRMDDNRLPKILVYGECCSGKALTGRKELNYKHLLRDDMEKFNISRDFNFWNRLSLNRQEWRMAVKSSGLSFFMQNWFTKRANDSNKRHRRVDPSYVDKECYIFSRTAATPMVCLEEAIKVGAVTVGRGSKEKHENRWSECDEEMVLGMQLWNTE